MPIYEGRQERRDRCQESESSIPRCRFRAAFASGPCLHERVAGQVLGEGATELVHLGQAAIATGATADFFIEQIFNFPTMSEAYRIAAFDILKQRTLAQPAPRRVAVAAR